MSKVKSKERQNRKLTRKVKEEKGLPTSRDDVVEIPSNAAGGKTVVTATPKNSRVAPGDTVAGLKEYNDFLGLLAKAVRENRVSQIRSLGYIPGPAGIFEFREGGEVRVYATTSDVARIFKNNVPTPWMKWEALPEKIRKALGEWKACVDGIGYEPSPFNLGLARGLLEGRVPTKYLAMAMPHFRYRQGDQELPFSVALLPVMVGGEVQGLKVKIFNPRKIPDMPADGTILTLDELKNGRGPVQKLLRTCALMEDNFLSRYDREGNRRSQVTTLQQVR